MTAKQVNQLARIAKFIVLESQRNIYNNIVENIFGVSPEQAMRLLIDGTESQKLMAISKMKDYLLEKQQITVDKETAEIKAEVPLAETFGYTTVLRSLTQGRGNHSLSFLRYHETPGTIADSIIAK